MNNQSVSGIRKFLSWSIHGFTASGLIAGFMSMLEINSKDWKGAMLWLLIAFIIDGIDGTFARMVKIEATLPHIKGKMIDTVVDFVNYAFIPAYFMYYAGIFPENINVLCVALILITSAIYYGKEGMVLDDRYFVGFPVLWNMVAFYLFFVFDFSGYTNVIVIIAFAVLHFIPVRFPYPSRKSDLQIWNLFFSTLLILSFLVIGYKYPEKYWLSDLLAIISAVYFLGLSLYGMVSKK